MARLTKDDWTAAALAALADGGLASVAIEPLAARLGTTKGSAYWHFPNRDALLHATLDRWEHDNTEAVIALVESASAEPADRLRHLFATVLEADRAAHIELALQASADHPLVVTALRRVTTRRLTYLATLFTQLGFPPPAARRRALLAHAIYLGQAQLTRSTPAVLPATPAARRAHLADVLHTMTVPPP